MSAHMGYSSFSCKVGLESDLPKVNVFRAASQDKIFVSLFLHESPVIGITYLDMLVIWLFPRLEEESGDCIFQHLYHHHIDVSKTPRG
ncbi:hypothetical protein AVEN_69011-1 [Araneus ventricosus]|uniref:Uncharacterized protein n=1 Tax=Araneus ventricosus TaxID=182803 RepID=A0A4Y2QP50_ARAVE|nr:hypothetical protein AVEN_69011-1 [Araneus ventricosus]